MKKVETARRIVRPTLSVKSILKLEEGKMGSITQASEVVLLVFEVDGRRTCFRRM